MTEVTVESRKRTRRYVVYGLLYVGFVAGNVLLTLAITNGKSAPAPVVAAPAPEPVCPAIEIDFTKVPVCRPADRPVTTYRAPQPRPVAAQQPAAPAPTRERFQSYYELLEQYEPKER